MNTQQVADVVVSQMHAALLTLRSCIERCPADLWVDTQRRKIAFWRVPYHTLTYTDLYSSASEEAFEPWPKHVAEHQHLGPIFFDDNREPKIGDPTPQADMLEYEAYVRAAFAQRVSDPPLDAPSGFPWLDCTRLEVHLYNIRHVQHHAAMLSASLRALADVHVDWVRFGD